MAGIYVHIPFCKQACHYCDFHFSTSLKKKNELLKALNNELVLRKDELQDNKVETIYFGGGTPSLLTIDELRLLIDEVYESHSVAEAPEITLEANPDDLTISKIHQLSESPINRLSIGIQSFLDDDLKMMNRAHSSQQAKRCLDEVMQYFDNVTIDLIYGIQDQSDAQWQENLDIALSYSVPHISSYALTVEPRTALASFIKKGLINDVDEAQSQRQFRMMVQTLKANDFVHYEISNFGKKGYFSKHNMSYWQGKSYLGIGPSAHSFNGEQRSWNVSNNNIYVKKINEGSLPSEIEQLSENDKFNEQILTGLRTINGVALSDIEEKFGVDFRVMLLEISKKYVDQGLINVSNDQLTLTEKGKFLADGIASDMFRV